MAECSFCGEKLKPGTGFLYVKRDGTALFFCSRKCEKNLLMLKRKPSATKWTTPYQEAKKASKAEKKKKARVEKPKKEKKEAKKKKKKVRRKKKAKK
jgi:large subunit ribosomal protein L24e